MKNTFILLILVSLISCKKETAYIPGSFHALDLFTKSRAYPSNDIPKKGFYAAHQYAKQMPFLESRGGEQWEAMGPLNTSGRTLTIGINPQAPRTIYAGSASGGIWRSRNLGLELTWERIETGFPVLGVSTIEFAHQDSTLMYIGTGEVYNYDVTGNDGAYRSTRGSYGIGILKSTDGGNTWEMSLDRTYDQRFGIWMIKVDPNDANISYAATTEGVFKTEDRGATWEMKYEVPMCTDIDINPQNSNNIVMSCGNFSTPGKGIFYSLDAGESWTQSIGVPDEFNGKILIARSASESPIMYASVGNGFSFVDGYTWLLRSGDGGQNWAIMNELDYSEWQGWFSHDIAIHPEDPNTLMAVGIGTWKSTNAGLTLDQKSDGGLSLGNIELLGPDGPPDYVHSDQHFVCYHPAIPDLVMIGSDGGLFISYDGGENFRSANAGYQSTQFYNGFSVSPTNKNLALGGLQDNSTSIFDGDETWKRDLGGDGSWTAISAADENIFFGSSQRLNILRTFNGGLSYNNISAWQNDDIPLFISPFVLSPSEEGVIYAAGEYVYRSSDYGSNWDVTNSSIKLNGDPIYAMDISDVDENVVYVGTAPETTQAAIFNTIDGGEQWNDITNSGLPDRIVNDITVYPGDPSSAIAVYSGFGTDHVFRTRDYGATWQSIDANLPDLPTNAVIVDPFEDSHIYIGNDIGVFVSIDDGVTFNQFQAGLPTACIAMDLKVSKSDGMLWVATHGNGTYRVPLLSDPSVANLEIQPADVKVYPNPTRDVLYIQSTKLNDYVVSLLDLNGKLIYQDSNTESIDTKSLLPGTYFIKIQQDKTIITEKIIKL